MVLNPDLPLDLSCRSETETTTQAKPTENQQLCWLSVLAGISFQFITVATFFLAFVTFFVKKVTKKTWLYRNSTTALLKKMLKLTFLKKLAA